MYDETPETDKSYFKVTCIVAFVAFHIVQCFSNASWHTIEGIAQIIQRQAD